MKEVKNRLFNLHLNPSEPSLRKFLNYNFAIVKYLAGVCKIRKSKFNLSEKRFKIGRSANRLFNQMLQS